MHAVPIMQGCAGMGSIFDKKRDLVELLDRIAPCAPGLPCGPPAHQPKCLTPSSCPVPSRRYASLLTLNLSRVSSHKGGRTESCEGFLWLASAAVVLINKESCQMSRGGRSRGHSTSTGGFSCCQGRRSF